MRKALSRILSLGFGRFHPNPMSYHSSRRTVASSLMQSARACAENAKALKEFALLQGFARFDLASDRVCST